MILTPEQQALLDGKEGEIMAKIVKTLVMYGDAFGAERMVPVTSKYGHTVISFGLEVMKPVYDLYDTLIAAGLPEGQKFTADPRPLDPKVPSSLLDDLVFKKIMYTQQQRYEEQVRKLGITRDEDYTCACYLDQVGNIPQKGDVLSWAESSAVVYANSVLGARCNRNSGMLELMGSIAGFVPEFGLLTPEAVEQGEALIAENAQVYVIDDAELQRVRDSYPVIWKKPDAKPELCFVGCPHMSLQQLKDWAAAVRDGLEKNGRKKVAVPTVFTAPMPVLKEFEQSMDAYYLMQSGVELSYICPLMYMNNPLCKKKAVITSSNKLRTYTSAKYHTEAEILTIITGGAL